MANVGREIRPKRRRLVGVATESTTSFGRSIFRGILQYANLQRNWTILKDMWHVTPATKWPDCDGIIIGGLQEIEYENLRGHSRHLITCSGRYDPDEIPTVALDDEAAGALAAQHLAHLGLKHFAFYGPAWVDRQHSPSGRVLHPFGRRASGYRRELEALGYSCARFEFDLPSRRNLLDHSHHPLVLEWLRSLPRPTGIMACDDTHANDLAEACSAGGILVPDHIAIVGVNNDDLLCESAWPPLSSVECGFERMGFLAAKTLDRMMLGEDLAPDERLVTFPPVRVEQRLSTSVVAVGVPTVVDAVRFIREHACDPCSVDDVTQALAVSRRTLERQFVGALGRTIHDEIAKVRADTACRLLGQPSLTTREVAERCGFSTVQAFERFFRQLTKSTPAAFRRRDVQQLR